MTFPNRNPCSELIKPLSSILATLLSLILATLLGVSGCAGVSKIGSGAAVTVPQVESAPDREITRPSGESEKVTGGLAFAWREPPVSADKPATIFTQLIPGIDRVTPTTITPVWEPSVDTGPIEFVRLGDEGRYFIAWPDQGENDAGQSVPVLRWAIWSGISGRIEEQGEWEVGSEFSVAELAAAYNPAQLIGQETIPATVLIAVLIRNTAEFGECVMNSREGTCQLHICAWRIAIQAAIGS